MNQTDLQQPPAEPLVDLILTLASAKRWDTLKEIRRLIYQPFRSRYHSHLFSILPDKETGVTYYSLRQAYRLVGPLMAYYPRTVEAGNFGRSLGELEQVVGSKLVERKLLVIRQSPRLHLAEPTLLALVKLMQQHNIFINWRQMVRDARYWNEQSIVHWYEGLVAVRNQREKTE